MISLRELAYVNSVENLEFEWLLNDDERPTDIEVRVYLVVADVPYYWNGNGFAAPDATLPGTFLDGVWKGEFLFPGEAVNQELFIEARPIGLPDIEEDRITSSRYVVTAPTGGSGSTGGPVAKTGTGSPLSEG